MSAGRFFESLVPSIKLYAVTFQKILTLLIHSSSENFKTHRYLSGSRYGPLTGFCENSNEFLGSIESEQFLDQLKNMLWYTYTHM